VLVLEETNLRSLLDPSLPASGRCPAPFLPGLVPLFRSPKHLSLLWPTLLQFSLQCALPHIIDVGANGISRVSRAYLSIHLPNLAGVAGTHGTYEHAFVGGRHERINMHYVDLDIR